MALARMVSRKELVIILQLPHDLSFRHDSFAKIRNPHAIYLDKLMEELVQGFIRDYPHFWFDPTIHTRNAMFILVDELFAVISLRESTKMGENAMDNLLISLFPRP